MESRSNIMKRITTDTRPSSGERLEAPESRAHHADEISRSMFLRTAGSTALFASLGVPFLISCSGTVTDPDQDGSGDGGGNGITINGNIVTIDVTKSGGQSLASAGGWLLNTSAGIIAVNLDGATIRAFTNVCTHSNCSDSWQFSNNLFICTCHDSRFNTSGEVVKGPADRDLREYEVSRNGSIITITKG
jgi:cytochrome b6-f complex iron-sulfur subunit